MIKKIIIILSALFLSFFSVWAPMYLSESSNTAEMNEYIKEFDEFRERGTLSAEEKLQLGSKEELFIEDVNSDDYIMKKFLSDYIFVPLLVILFSIFWFILGALISFESLFVRAFSFICVAGLILYFGSLDGLPYFLMYSLVLFVAVFSFPRLLAYIRTLSARDVSAG